MYNNIIGLLLNKLLQDIKTAEDIKKNNWNNPQTKKWDL